MKISVIIPVYNEESTITEIIARVRAVDLDKEIIIVDDGSTDGTSQQLKAIGGKFDDVNILIHKKNLGKGAESAGKDFAPDYFNPVRGRYVCFKKYIF